ncbi:MAG: hypothetical protein RAO92_03640 [Candidatus Euphemobacter frigidus]|nr:hypothetical protein [Candidatus Euphemobacter frigidus]MDP8275475.1 hypothetical protein [Candidatus Euphemobacter frigidus]
MSAVRIEKFTCGGWKNCLRLTNGLVEVVVTTDVGPRVIRYGFSDAPNMFCEVEKDRGRIGGDEWRMYGGHRLWHSPEDNPRTYPAGQREGCLAGVPGRHSGYAGG